MPNQEEVVVAQWVSGIWDVWIQRNQSVYQALRTCRTWAELAKVVHEEKRMLNEDFMHQETRSEQTRSERRLRGVQGRPDNDNNVRPAGPAAAGAGGALPALATAPSAQAAAGNTERQPAGDNQRRSAPRGDVHRCYNCGGTDGHIARECEQPRQRYRGRRGGGRDPGNFWEGL